MKRLVLIALSALTLLGTSSAQATKGGRGDKNKASVVKKSSKKSPKKGPLVRNTTLAGKPFFSRERVLSLGKKNG